MSKNMENLDMLSAYADGELADTDAQRTAEYIDSSEEYPALLEMYREISSAVNESGEPVPDELRIGVMSAIAGDVCFEAPPVKARRKINRRMLLTRAMPIAACLVVALLVWGLFGDFFSLRGDIAADFSGNFAAQVEPEAAMGGYADEDYLSDSEGFSDAGTDLNAVAGDTEAEESYFAEDAENALADTVPNATPMPAGEAPESDSAPAPEPVEMQAADDGMSGDSEAGGYKKITPEEAVKIMDAADEYILLDVRTKEEYLEQRISGAVLIPLADIGDRARVELPDKDAIIIIYCRAGVRSAAAAELLADMGYSRVYDMGGIIYWPYATVK